MCSIVNLSMQCIVFQQMGQPHLVCLHCHPIQACITNVWLRGSSHSKHSLQEFVLVFLPFAMRMTWIYTQAWTGSITLMWFTVLIYGTPRISSQAHSITYIAGMSCSDIMYSHWQVIILHSNSSDAIGDKHLSFARDISQWWNSKAVFPVKTWQKHNPPSHLSSSSALSNLI